MNRKKTDDKTQTAVRRPLRGFTVLRCHTTFTLISVERQTLENVNIGRLIYGVSNTYFPVADLTHYAPKNIGSGVTYQTGAPGWSCCRQTRRNK